MIKNIRINELKTKLDEIVKHFKVTTNAIVCSLIDKNGFLIASEKDAFINDKNYNENLINLCNTIDNLAKYGSIDIKNNTELISIEFAYLNLKSTILIREINNNITFISIFPKILNLELVKIEFDRIIERISRYFLEIGKNFFIKPICR